MIEQILEADRYLQVDRVEKARGIYERVVELDPGNAIAVVGLARCALAEGDDRGAYELASRALEIDPENEMARRMEARLSEILTTRGEDVARPDAAAVPSSHEMRAVVTEEAESDRTPALTIADTATEPTPTTEPPARRLTPTPRATKEAPVRKSFFDRLLGR